MAGKSNTSATFFAQKKLLGKANTSLLKTDGEELIGSNIQAASSQVFGQVLPENPSKTLYLMQSASNGGPATVEYIHFQIDVITGSTYNASDTGLGAGSDSGESSQSSGPHSYKFRFRSDYESSSSNPKKGNGNFSNTKILHETLGKVQLIPPFFSQAAPNPYIVEIFKDNGSGGIGDKIDLTDNIDWNVDYYNGILFIQDYDASKIPAHGKAFAYVGDFADGGFFENSLSGSLQKLTDGNSYLVAGNNVTITSASNGQVTISSTGGGGSGSSFFNETSSGFINTTGSVSFAGGEGASHTTTAVGTDTFFFVSGSLNGDDKSVFGGDLAVSGTLAVNKSAAVGSQVHITSAGKVGIGTSTPAYKLSVGGSMEIGEYLYHRNDTDTFVRLQSDEITLSAGDKNMINLKEDGVNTQVLIMSGGAASSYDETTGNDVSFYVSGSVGSAKTNSKGTAVFGGDVVVSGSFVNSDISGSLTQLTDGTSYILSNGSISVTTQSNGSIILSAANSVFNEYIGEANGSNTRFTLDHTPTANKNVSVFVNGQLQMPATNITGAPFQDYSVTGSVIFFTTGSLPPQESLLVANYTTNQSIS